MIDCLGFGQGDVAGGPKEAVVVEPVDPTQGCHFEGRGVWPGPPSQDDLGLAKAGDGLGRKHHVNRHLVGAERQATRDGVVGRMCTAILVNGVGDLV